MALKQQNCYTKILPISNPLIFLHASILTHDAQLQSTLKMFKDVKRMMQVMLNKSIPRDNYCALFLSYLISSLPIATEISFCRFSLQISIKSQSVHVQRPPGRTRSNPDEISPNFCPIVASSGHHTLRLRSPIGNKGRKRTALLSNPLTPT